MIFIIGAFIAQVVERSLGKTEVSGSSPDEGSFYSCLIMSKNSITFPQKEWPAYKKLLQEGLPIYTTRVQAEVGRYQVGKVYRSQLGQLKVVAIKKLQHLEDHPFLDELSDYQKGVIARSLEIDDVMEIIKLERVSDL